MANVGEKVGGVVSKGKRRLGMERPSAAEDEGLVGIVRGALLAFGEGDHDAFLDVLNEDVVWEAPEGEQFPGAGPHRGRDAVRDGFIADASRTYTEFGFRPDSFLDAEDDDAVVVIGRFIGQGVQGDNLDTQAIQIWEFKGNSAVRVCTVADSATFPKVVTEKQEEEWREEDRQKEKEEEEEEKEKEEAKGEDEDEAEGKDETEGEGKDEDEAEGKDETEGKSEDETEGKGDAGRDDESEDQGKND